MLQSTRQTEVESRSLGFVSRLLQLSIVLNTVLLLFVFVVPAAIQVFS